MKEGIKEGRKEGRVKEREEHNHMHCKCVTKYLIRNLEAVRCREE